MRRYIRNVVIGALIIYKPSRALKLKKFKLALNNQRIRYDFNQKLQVHIRNPVVSVRGQCRQCGKRHGKRPNTPESKRNVPGIIFESPPRSTNVDHGWWNQHLSHIYFGNHQKKCWSQSSVWVVRKLFQVCQENCWITQCFAAWTVGRPSLTVLISTDINLRRLCTYPHV